MTTENQDFTMWSGDSKVLEVTLTDVDDDAVNLTGASISYILQKSSQGGEAIISKSVDDGISITSPATGGLFEITIDATDTDDLAGEYYHECQVTDSSSNVSTVFVGTVTIKVDMI